MKKLLFACWALMLMFFLTACGGSSAGEQAAEGENTEQNDSEAMADGEATEEEDKSQRKSPPRVATGAIDGVEVTVNYGSPSMRDREIWGALVPYGQLWRTGANEATTIEFSGDVTVEGQDLAAGKYALLTIPEEGTWTVIFNTATDLWGASGYDESKDALRVNVTPQALDEAVEAMEFSVEDGKVIMRWSDLAVPVSVAGKNAG